MISVRFTLSIIYLIQYFTFTLTCLLQMVVVECVVCLYYTCALLVLIA